MLLRFVERSLRHSLVLLLIILCNSCALDDYHFDEISYIQAEFNVAAPVSSGTFEVWGLIGGESKKLLSKDENEHMLFSYQQRNVFGYNVDPLVSLPSYLTIADDQIVIDEKNIIASLFRNTDRYAFQRSYDLSFENEDNPSLQVYSAVISSGSLSIGVQKHGGLDGAILKVKISNLMSLDDREVPMEFEIALDDYTTPLIIPIKNKKLDFQSNSFAEKIDKEYYLEFPKLDDSSVRDCSVDVQISMNDISYSSFVGDIGEHTIDIAKSKLDFDFPVFDKLSSGIYFTNPEIEISTRCGISVDAELQVDIDAEDNNGNIFSLEAPNARVFIPHWTNIGSVAYGAFTFDKHISNIDKLFSLPPSKYLTIGGRVFLNKPENGFLPVVNPTHPNMIYQGATFEADAQISIPIAFRSDETVFRDTIDFSPLNLEDISDVTLYLKYSNKIPLTMVLDVYPVCYTQKEKGKSSVVLGDAIHLGEILSPTIDEHGRPLRIAKGILKVSLSEESIEHLSVCHKLIVKLKSNTLEGRYIDLLASDFINLDFAVSYKNQYHNTISR
ncbi:hypothetical protein K4L44_11065 [Halosquirtibacter laminarini]|uniref:Uncharacterized protein n=1 Tax=Halosquirtibacter laminarini TaxID=3374600 RepID=A0AC61NMR1_9BACT|nr:hypothetical protein K4L44_11065 [Prolixibacteraceae bacterium]